MTPCTCNTDMGDTCPKCAPPAKVAPPKVGDKWGDLSPEQRAMVPVGTELSEPSDAPPCAYQPRVKVTADPYGYQWAERMGCVPIDRDESLIRDRRITRLGPAPTTEPDRSGWPVLVKDGADYRWGKDDLIAVWLASDRKGWCGAHRGGVSETFYPTAAVAADAVHARLPDEASEPAPTDPRDAEIARLRASLATALADEAEANSECADLRRSLEGQTLANAPLRDALSTLRGRLAHVLPDGPVTDDAIVAAVRALADHANADAQDDAMLTAGLGLLEQAAIGNPTLGSIATVIRRGVGR